MLYVVYGADTLRARKKFDELVLQLTLKRSGASLFRFNSISWDTNRYEELLSSSGLFVKNFIVALNRVSENPEAFEFVINHLAEIKKSSSVFIVLEEEPSTLILEKFKKYAEKIQEYRLEVRGERLEGRGFNIFALTDALGERDRKKLWVLLQKAYFNGQIAEEIFWRLSWMVKTMLLASQTKTAEEAGMKEYPFKKAVLYAKNYRKEELINLSEQFIKLYHDNRRGITEFNLGLEKLVLSL